MLFILRGQLWVHHQSVKHAMHHHQSVPGDKEISVTQQQLPMGQKQPYPPVQPPIGNPNYGIGAPPPAVPYPPT